jgi:hypothetical protein
MVVVVAVVVAAVSLDEFDAILPNRPRSDLRFVMTVWRVPEFVRNIDTW